MPKRLIWLSVILTLVLTACEDELLTDEEEIAATPTAASPTETMSPEEDSSAEPDPTPTSETVATPVSEQSFGPDCVDLNSAGLEDLQRIEHVGPDRAEEIIRLRESNPFVSVDSLRRVDGIGPSRLEGIHTQGLACVQDES
jgi:competence ComEA-like helix-hairpin-helix protein